MLDNYFNFKGNDTDFKTEILAGITTFLAMAYILGVNPTMLADVECLQLEYFLQLQLHQVLHV